MPSSFKCKTTLLLFLLALTLFPSPIYAVCKSTTPTLGECPAGLQQIEEVFARVISVAVGLGFITMLVLLIFAGFKYLISGGEPKAIQSAHNTVTWALLGVVFMAIAWLILQLIHTFTGIDVTLFSIKALCGGASLPFCQ